MERNIVEEEDTYKISLMLMKLGKEYTRGRRYI
jgi:hypothetical protein